MKRIHRMKTDRTQIDLATRHNPLAIRAVLAPALLARPRPRPAR